MLNNYVCKIVGNAFRKYVHFRLNCAFTLVTLNSQAITDYISGITVASNLLITPLIETISH
jgi:hypothetical protein